MCYGPKQCNGVTVSGLVVMQANSARDGQLDRPRTRVEKSEGPNIRRHSEFQTRPKLFDRPFVIHSANNHPTATCMGAMQGIFSLQYLSTSNRDGYISTLRIDCTLLQGVEEQAAGATRASTPPKKGPLTILGLELQLPNQYKKVLTLFEIPAGILWVFQF
jgi:hypothetical protein